MTTRMVRSNQIKQIKQSVLHQLPANQMDGYDLMFCQADKLPIEDPVDEELHMPCIRIAALHTEHNARTVSASG
jgi:hypothetical protein